MTISMLSLALKARVPFVHVQTDDILYVQETLTFISGEECLPLQGPTTPDDITTVPLGAAGIFFTSQELAIPELYFHFKAKGKTLVFVNTKKSVLHYETGPMIPPIEMVRQFIAEHDPTVPLDDVIQGFGGLNLKESFDVVKLTNERDSGVTGKGVSATRKGYIQRLKGITQVDTETEFYQPPSYLTDWCDQNLSFFADPPHPSLMPRGILADGPPGTGKTEAAKYLARELGMPLYRLDVGAMKGKYVGDSEANLNAALQQIDQVAPCVVLFDEIEKVFGASGDGNGHETTTSMLSSILWWLQEHKTQVFTMMTTNAVGRIPPELHREGRIDAKLTFNGIESPAQAVEFAQCVANNFAAKVGLDLDFKTIRPEVEAFLKVKMGTGAKPIAQSTLTEEVKAIIKRVLKTKGA